MKRDGIRFIVELPEGYTYRFFENETGVFLMGINPDKKPIVVDAQGTITELELEW